MHALALPYGFSKPAIAFFKKKIWGVVILPLPCIPRGLRIQILAIVIVKQPASYNGQHWFVVCMRS